MQKVNRILYAEDNLNDIELTLAAFAENNLANAVDVVRDGQEALDYLNRSGKYQNRPPEPPVVILLDIKMPKIDGIDVLKQIKQSQALKSIPVVMLTSSQIETDLVKSYELGANAFVIKPIDFTEFMNAIKNIALFWAITNKTS
jgi:CheY-like chemotaxis protein